ncbi:MAG: glycoside hydrolase, family 85 [Akkermansiaceae bacterium]|nr:glycoside hydrolase, family 85 [Akkermansiaceae bacterium]
MQLSFRALVLSVIAAVLPAGAQTSLAPIAPSWSPASILAWDPATDPVAPFNVSQVPLAARISPPKASENAALSTLLNVNPYARPKEGKVEALISWNSIPAAAQGWRSTRVYAPTTWQYMDVVGHWGGSGGVISIPNAHITDAAHRNGVSIHGLVFLAPRVYGGTTAVVNDFIATRSNGSFPVADKMIQAARYFKFDGYFINMETEGSDAAAAVKMQNFMLYFRAQAPELAISWYDSMVSSGGISWQRQLNGSNQMFLQSGTKKVADSMFLDFYWQNSANLANSRSLARSLGRSEYDVYAGIDTEGAGDNGTNTFGGSTPLDWNQIFPAGQPHTTSLGIYRPEWTFNYSGNPSDAINREVRYWCGQNSDPSNTSIPSGGNPRWPGIAKFIPAKSPLTSLPFVTNFDLGQGERFMINGVSKMTGQWTNLSLQDILPTWKWIVSSAGTKLAPSFDFATAYYGGTSLKVAGTLTQGQPNEIKLYEASLPVAADTVARLTYKSAAVSSAQIEIGLAFEDAPETMVYLPSSSSSSTSWRTAEAPLGAYAGRRIVLMTLRFSTAATVVNYAVNLGRLEVRSGAAAVAPDAPTALSVLATGPNPDEAFSAQLRLKWTPSTSPVLHYNVYYRKDLTAATDSQRVWLGATPNSYFFAPDVRRAGYEDQGYIQVEAVGPDYAVSAPLSTEQATFSFPQSPNLHHPLIESYPVAAPITVIGSGDVANMTQAFDNNLGNFTEPGGDSNAWVGLSLPGRVRLTAIRFAPRAGFSGRMAGGQFQGSNDATFATGTVTLATVGSPGPPEGIETTLTVANTGTYRYFRYLGPGGGYCNVAEIRFYAFGPYTPPDPPAALQATVNGPTAKLAWTASTSSLVYDYRVRRSLTRGGPYETVAENLTTLTLVDNALTPGTPYYYVVSGRNDGGDGADSAELVVNPPAALELTGAPIGGGTPNGGNVPAKAFDGALSTYFEVTNDSGWVGLDLGTPRRITGLRYSPRNSSPGNATNANFMIGGRFQASTTADFSADVVTLATVPSAPAYNVMTAAAVAPAAMPYRYVRYVTAAGRNANVSEIEFYGLSAPTAPMGLTASVNDTTASLAWTAVDGALSYRVKRSTVAGGPYEEIADGVTATAYANAGLTAGTAYYYVVSAVNDLGEGPDSAEASTVDAYAQWLNAAGIDPAGPDSAFDQDADHDGISNGVAYMVPAGLAVSGGDTPGVSAVVRIDPAVTATLWLSTDLANWTAVEFAIAPDQDGVAPGFQRISATGVTGATAGYYRMKFVR